MTSEEIKIEIHKIIDSLPDDALSEALIKIKKLIEEEEEKKYDRNFEKILKDNADLFKRLADS